MFGKNENRGSGFSLVSVPRRGVGTARRSWGGGGKVSARRRVVLLRLGVGLVSFDAISADDVSV